VCDRRQSKPTGHDGIMTDNEKLVRSFYQAILPGHRERVFSIQAAHVVYELPEGMPVAGGRFEGIEAVMDRFLPAFYGALDVRFDADEFITAGENVVASGRLRGATREGEIPIDVPFVQVWTVRDGRLARMRGFLDTATLTRAIDDGRRSAR
jgi:ketosteroid isomerase-like protein